MSGAADLNLRLNYWYLNHKDQLMRWWMLTLIAVDTIILGFWVVAMFAVRTDGSAVSKQLTIRTEASLFAADARGALATPLIIGTAAAAPSTDGTVDLLVEFKNENEVYVADEIQYRFRYGETTTPVRTTFIRPASSRFVVESSVPVAAKATASVELLSVGWQRPRLPKVLQQISFAIGVIELDVAALTTSTPPQPAPRVKATVRNTSLFTFREAEVVIAVVEGNRPLAVDRVLVKDWAPQTDKTVTAQWLRSIPAAARVIVVPQVNPLDEANFLRP